MRVLVAAWVGSSNLGDELLFRALSRRLQGMGAEVAAVSRDPETTRLVHGVRAIGDRDPIALARAADSADLVVFGGGGLLQDATSVLNLPYHLARIAAARRAGTPVVGVGLGVGPLTTRIGRRQVAVALLGRGGRRPIPVAARDADSVALLRELGVQPVLAADLAFGPELAGDVPTGVRDTVAVCLRPWTGGGRLPVALNWQRGVGDAPFVPTIAAVLDAVTTRTGLGIEFVALQAGRDDILHQRVAEQMANTDKVSLVTPSLGDLLGTVGSARVVVTMRYHGAVAAALAGRPAVLLGYTSKIGELAADLGVGADLAARDMDSRAPVDLALADHVEAALADERRRTASLLQARDRLREREVANSRLLDAALGG